MKTATAADLRNSFASVSKWIHQGESVLITKRGRPFATLSPSRKRKVIPPLNRLARLRKAFPNGPVKGCESTNPTSQIGEIKLGRKEVQWLKSVNIVT